MKKYNVLRLVLGDQLNASHSWYETQRDDVLYLTAELHQETNYTVHHKQKVAAFFAAMEAFSTAIQAAGHNALHLSLDDTASYKTLPNLLSTLIQQHDIQQFEYQLPDEYRLRAQLSEFCQAQQLECTAYETEHFYISDHEIGEYFQQGKRHRMESFYRKLRVRFNILMSGDAPEGGQWNYDKLNREKLKPSDFDSVPEPLCFANNVVDVLARIEKHQVKTMGQCSEHIVWPINRQQALELLDYFCRFCLPKFGQYQDAMTGKLDDAFNQKQWSLYHSRLSFALNTKMIPPQKVIDTALQYYFAQAELEIEISIAQIEGFVRQILGWREFVRGIYWVNMPEYATLNHLQADRNLPAWFWTGDTKMNCLKHAVNQSLETAYAHHIQRLMVTGNFCLIAGIHPQQVDDWYLGIYIDAIEWVELPNTRGMSQFADGGIVGSKAYSASGNYINKMSDYCGDCHYKVSQTVEETACPLNSLYWHFMVENQTQFKANPRNRMIYGNWQKRPLEIKSQVLEKAKKLLSNLDDL